MVYLAPQSLSEALTALSSPTARILAGGTDVFAVLDGPPPAGDLVDLTRIPALRGIARKADGGVVIGAAATWAELCRAALPAAFDGLKAASREVGSIQIQNAATLAGNLCNASPAADGVPPLLTLDAQVAIAGPAGARRLPLADFILGPRRTALAPGELVSAIEIPPQPAGAAGAFVKLGARRYLVISIAMVAAVLAPAADGTIAHARVAVGACSPVAQRLAALEAALIGQPMAEAAAVVAPAHVAGLAPIDDTRATASYRAGAALELTRRALVAAASRSAAP
ncbi:MAG: xanthine dehydrogenase family protein subunit M [Acuticoccus sp.]